MSDRYASMKELILQNLGRGPDGAIIGETRDKTAAELLDELVEADRTTKAAADDERAQKMHARLCEVARLVGPIRSPVSVARAAHIAIMHTWGKGERRPALAVVLSAPCLARPNQAQLPYLHPAWPELVRAGLADSSDMQTPDDYAHSFESNRPIYFFFNEDASHSVIRWVNPAGDRTIVVMPPEYYEP